MIFVSLLLASLSAPASGKGAVKKLLGESAIRHPDNVPNIAQLPLYEEGFYADRAGSAQDVNVRHTICPGKTEYTLKTANMKGFALVLCTGSKLCNRTAEWRCRWLSRRQPWCSR